MKSDQELYKRLRELPKEELWKTEVENFNAAAPRERMEQVAVIRAVGMMFSRFGTEEEKAAVREWLIALLRDPQEKIRRYAMAALPKIGAGEKGEVEMLALLNASDAREKRHLSRALEKVGGEATLAVIGEGAVLPAMTEQKVKAAVSRRDHPGRVRMEALLSVADNTRVLLRCRCGLEEFVRKEVQERLSPAEWLVEKTVPGCVTLKPLQEFTLTSLYRLRCFATVSFPLGTITVGSHANADSNSSPNSDWVEPLARCIASARTREIMISATEGNPRYRLEFTGRGHLRGAVRQVVDRAYALCPEILNDARQAPWSVEVTPSGKGAALVELRPRLYPDPRLWYRQDDVAAASHPPLAACMARLAKLEDKELVWDPFCGSGLELVECGLLGGVSAVYGTDLDPGAIEVAQANFSAAKFEGVRASFTCCDFRHAGKMAGVVPGSLSLVITNPPLGRRVRIKDMQGLFTDLYTAASRALRTGGRLVFVNPLGTGPADPSLKLEYRQPIDLGGFTCRLEMYRKIHPVNHPKQTNPSRSASLATPGTPSAKRPPEPAWWSRVGRAAHWKYPH